MTDKKTLENALAEMEANIAKAAELQVKQLPELEAETAKQNALDLRLAALSQSQRRQVLNEAGLRHISAAPPPITPLKGSSYRLPIKRPFEQPIDWRYWRHMPEVKQWEACALSLNIDPLNLKHSSNAWMSGVGGAPKFSLANFPSEAVQTEFDKRLRLLGTSLFKSGYFTTVNKLVMGGRHLATISLDQFARWGLHVELEMPPELVTLGSGQQSKQPEKALEQTKELNAMRMPGDGGMSVDSQWLNSDASVDKSSHRAGVEQTRSETISVALPKQRVQELRLIELLKSQHYDPLKMPLREPGKGGAKAEVRKLALLESKLFTTKSFDIAWQRLRDDGSIVDDK